MFGSIAPIAAAAAIFPMLVATYPSVATTVPRSLHYTHTLHRTSLFNGEVQWTDMTSNDGKKQGIDDDGIDYFITALEHFVEEIPADERVGVFRTGGAQTEEVEFEMNEFIETHLDSRGAQFDSIFDPEYTNAQILFGCAETENLEWRLIYRASKALAAGVTNGVAYIHMSRANGRTIFSTPSKDPQDNDPEHDDKATVGETWFYVELPMLMRNLNIHRIVSFWKESDGFSTHVEWDANRDRDSFPRNYLQDIAMDNSPIRLLDVAEREPMKRSFNGISREMSSHDWKED